MKEMICIVCPKGCRLRIDDALHVSGNACPRGAIYAKNELCAPMRQLTTTVAIAKAIHRRCPIQTSAPIPKEKQREVMEYVRTLNIVAPIAMHEVIAHNVCGLGVDLIATRTMNKINDTN